jgi:hypothetical protein
MEKGTARPVHVLEGHGELEDDPRASTTSQEDQGNVCVQAGVRVAAAV